MDGKTEEYLHLLKSAKRGLMFRWNCFLEHLQPNDKRVYGVVQSLQPNVKSSAIYLRVNSATSILAFHCSSTLFCSLNRIWRKIARKGRRIVTFAEASKMEFDWSRITSF
ncbi:hypothetical protein KFK09_022463 [Dendrobium nobile]|uniref:Uncharacterized protein n=1 Tax=Dendrobium nobile TaxID=94219 RepID=A0A8T3AHX9_DENNO|nr:hypothetical protein KFK09_022463 [Dendrobium nobile]